MYIPKENINKEKGRNQNDREHVTNGQTKKTEGQAGNELSFANEY